MQQVLKQSTAATTVVGPAMDSTGAAYTGLVIGDLNITKNGTTAAMAAAATLTHDHNGHYILVFTTGNTDTLGRLDVTVNKATYAMPPKCFEVLAAAAFDTIVTNGTLASTTSGRTIVTDAAGLVDANVVKLGPTGAGTAQTAKDVGAAVPAAAAGASGGLLISGSNAGTTTFGALTVTGASTFTGNLSCAAGITVTQSTGNGAAVSLTGNGSGAGLLSTGGSSGHGVNAVGTGTGHGAYFIGGATNGDGLLAFGQGNGAGVEFLGAGVGAGISAIAGTTGIGFKVAGGGTSGVGMQVSTTSGDGVSVLPTAGSALVLTANGTSKHGAIVTGGTAGTSDGVKAVAGTGGVPIRGDITGNITGALSGSVGSVTGAVGSITGVTFPTNFSVLSISASTGLVDITQTAADKAWSTTTRQLTGTQTFNVTGNITGNLSGSVGSVTGAVGSVGSGGITAATFAAGAIDASAIATDAITSAELATTAVSEIASGVWTYVIENSKTAEQFMRIIKASAGGKLSGAATSTIVIRDDADSKARITATVDSSGNRSAVTLDGT